MIDKREIKEYIKVLEKSAEHNHKLSMENLKNQSFNDFNFYRGMVHSIEATINDLKELLEK